MYPKAYIEFLAYFHGSRDYFECHEVLEEYWKDEQGGNGDIVWVGLIQMAVSLYHFRRSNFPGAKRMLKKAINIVYQTKNELEQLALNSTQLLNILEQLLQDIDKQQSFYDIHLPITDNHLLQLCKETCLLHGFQFGAESDLTNDDLVHKHKLRDRQGVILERQHRLQEKKRRRLTD